MRAKGDEERTAMEKIEINESLSVRVYDGDPPREDYQKHPSTKWTNEALNGGNAVAAFTAK